MATDRRAFDSAAQTSCGKPPKKLAAVSSSGMEELKLTTYSDTFIPQAWRAGRQWTWRCEPLSTGSSHRSSWSSGCVSKKPLPLPSQNPTATPEASPLKAGVWLRTESDGMTQMAMLLAVAGTSQEPMTAEAHM